MAYTLDVCVVEARHRGSRPAVFEAQEIHECIDDGREVELPLDLGHPRNTAVNSSGLNKAAGLVAGVQIHECGGEDILQRSHGPIATAQGQTATQRMD